MKKKKITSLLVAGALTVGIVGGTLAWLTASDVATNKFKTSETTVDVDIYENFDKDAALALIPGDVAQKQVQIKNSANFDQFIRVKLTLENDEALNNYPELNYANIITEDNPNGSWMLGEDGYYYYMGKVGAGKFTNLILESVKFPNYASQEQMNKSFDVKVETKSVQASNGAYKDAFEGAGEAVLAKLGEFESQDAVGNEKEVDGAEMVSDSTGK